MQSKMLIREKVRDLMVASICEIDKKKRVRMGSREKNITQFEIPMKWQLLHTKA